MKGAEIPERIRNTWSNQEYREQIGVHGGRRNTWKK